MTNTNAAPLVPTQDELLRRILDESACRAVLARYGAALDWQDRQALEAVFWPDADIDYGFFKGTAADFIPVLLHIATLSLRRFHMMSGERLLINGASADAECYLLTQAISQDSAGVQTASVFYGRCLDRLERRHDEWRIARRVYLQHGAYAGPYIEDKMLKDMLNADGLNTEHPLFRRI
jgi:SnoaL-like domain